MSSFAVACLFTTLLTMGILMAVILRARFLLVKPSIWVVSFFHLQIQWAAAIEAPRIEANMLYPWHFYILTQLFPLAALLLSLLFFRAGAKSVWSRMSQSEVNTPVLSKPELLVLVLAWVAIVAFYFLHVPPTTSGLWVLITSKDYLMAVLAREDSLKLLSNPLVKYAYAYNSGFLALFLGLFVTIAGVQALKRRNFLAASIAFTFYCCLLVSSALSGARSPAAVVLMGTVGGFWLRSLAPFSPVRILTASFLVLSIPTLFTLLRSGEPLTAEAFQNYFSETVISRAFYAPMHTGELYCAYVQENGYWGAGGLGRIALIFGAEPINVANFMATSILGTSVESAYMNTSFVFAFYSAMGLPIIPILFILVLILDVIVLFYQRTSNRYLLAAMVAINTGCLSLINSSYTTLFFTRGYIPGLLTVAAMMLVFDPALRMRLMRSKHGLTVEPEGNVKAAEAHPL